MYELGHVWVYLDEAQQPVWVEASSHGVYASMILEDGTIPLDDGHPVFYSQPGKQAFSPTPHWFRIFQDLVFDESSTKAGEGGCWSSKCMQGRSPKHTKQTHKWLPGCTRKPSCQR
jgi:hypothetical protein